MRFFRLNPITRKRLSRFRQLKRGYYSLLILIFATVLSLFANFIANDRPIVVKYEGEFFFPTYKFISMSTFGQEDPYGYGDMAEADYRALKKDFEGTDNWVLMPPIPFHPNESDDASYTDPGPQPPDSIHYLGTNVLNQDVLARLIYGFRISMIFALVVVTIGMAFGIIYGSLLGYLGRLFDLTNQRFIEIWSSLPFLYVVILIRSFFEPSFWILVAIMIAFEWIAITYYMRTEMYREKSREYCIAAESIGASGFRIMFKHLLPNCLTPVVTLAPFAIVTAISSLTALDYLGFGLPTTIPTWGQMIEEALYPGNRDKLWLSFSPFTALVVTLILVTFVGESVREAFDPKQYARYR